MIKETMIMLILGTTVFLYAEGMPKNAKAGQCFTKSFYPPKYTKTMKIKSSKRVLLNDASVKYEVIPAQYSWYKEKVKVSDGREHIILTPALYKTVYDRVLVKPALTTWRKNSNNNAPKAFSSCVQSALVSGMKIKNVKVGTCFYEHYVAEKYITVTSKILVSEATQRVVVTPAKYRTVSKKIMIDNTSVKLLPSIATYKKVKDKIEIEPARREWKKTTCHDRGCNQSEVVCLIETPSTYKEIIKRIVLQPAVAKKVAVTPMYKSVKVEELVHPASSKIIEIPPKYQTVSQRKKVKDEEYYWSDASAKNAQTRLRSQCDKICLTHTPAKYKKIAKKIVVTPPHTKLVKSSAKYEMVKVKKILQEASFKKVVIPEEYITVITERERTKGYSKWMPMVCESNMTPKIIRKVQQALKFQGFYHGELNGIWNIESKSAGRAYQEENGLSITNKLSIETMKALEIY